MNPPVLHVFMGGGVGGNKNSIVFNITFIVAQLCTKTASQICRTNTDDLFFLLKYDIESTSRHWSSGKKITKKIFHIEDERKNLKCQVYFGSLRYNNSFFKLQFGNYKWWFSFLSVTKIQALKMSEYHYLWCLKVFGMWLLIAMLKATLIQPDALTISVH